MCGIIITVKLNKERKPNRYREVMHSGFCLIMASSLPKVISNCGE